jgi:hypothetical protein
MLSSKKSWEVASCSQGNTSVSCGSIAAARYSYLSVSYVPVAAPYEVNLSVSSWPIRARLPPNPNDRSGAIAVIA